MKEWEETNVHTHGEQEWEGTNIHTHGEQEWEERNINNRLCDLEQACEHSDDHARLWNSFDTAVTVSIWLYLGQRELHNTYESETVYINTTFIGSIQGQYTETGTLHSWAVYGDSIRRPRQLLHSNESAVYEDCIRNQSTQGQHITFIDSIRWLYTGTKGHTILFQNGIGCIRGQYTGPAYETYFLRLITHLTTYWQRKHTSWTRECIKCDPKTFRNTCTLRCGWTHNDRQRCWASEQWSNSYKCYIYLRNLYTLSKHMMRKRQCNTYMIQWTRTWPFMSLWTYAQYMALTPWNDSHWQYRQIHQGKQGRDHFRGIHTLATPGFVTMNTLITADVRVSKRCRHKI